VRRKLCFEHCVGQAEIGAELRCSALPLNLRWCSELRGSQKSALRCAASPTSQCAPALYVPTLLSRTEFFFCFHHYGRVLTCFLPGTVLSYEHFMRISRFWMLYVGDWKICVSGFLEGYRRLNDYKLHLCSEWIGNRHLPRTRDSHLAFWDYTLQIRRVCNCKNRHISIYAGKGSEFYTVGVCMLDTDYIALVEDTNAVAWNSEMPKMSSWI
jgi:hypothetical protein